jgi:hypothetical protein
MYNVPIFEVSSQPLIAWAMNSGPLRLVPQALPRLGENLARPSLGDFLFAKPLPHDRDGMVLLRRAHTFPR